MKYIPATDPQRSGTVADLNKLCSTVFEMDDFITTIEVCTDKSRCISDCIICDHLCKRVDRLTDSDRQAFMCSYETMQIKADILSDYLFEIEKAVKELNTLFEQAVLFFKNLDKNPTAIEYKSHTE